MSQLRYRQEISRCLEGYQLREDFPRIKISEMRCQQARRPFSSEAVAANEFVTVATVLRRRVANEELRDDAAQERVAKRLDRLQSALVGYDNAIFFQQNPDKEEEAEPTEALADNVGSAGLTQSNPQSACVSSTEHNKEPSREGKIRIPRGLYIYGEVGTGKTMLMDSFFSVVQVEKKQRFHFHSFLATIHTRIHDLKQQDLAEKGRNFSIDTSLSNNPIYRVGLQYASEVSLLCLDEFQVTDIADAVILSQLFSVLFAKGTVIVATSNRPPSDLYEGGLNRSYFLPFIDLLQKHCIVHKIQSAIDYRQLLSSHTSFFVKPEAIDPMTAELLSELNLSDGTAKTMSLDVAFQRILTLRTVYGGENDGVAIASFDFEELCDRDLGSLDYRSIAQSFDIVILKDIPTLNLEGHNVARRFITLIDELYEGKCALLCSSAVEATSPKDLFQPTSREPRNNQSIDMDDDILGIDVATQGGTAVGALASVRELAFAFERASSRLFEMCSPTWWERFAKMNVGDKL